VTAGSAKKLAICRELGADVLINYRDEDFVERVRAETDGLGADVILDLMGASYLDPQRRRAGNPTGGSSSSASRAASRRS